MQPPAQTPASFADQRRAEIEALEHRLAGEGRRSELKRTSRLLARQRAVLRWSALPRRVIDAALALFFLIALSPIFVVVLAATRGQLERRTRLGRWAEPFDLFEFDIPKDTLLGVLRHFGVQHLPKLVHVVRGQMAWIGPRPLRPDEVSATDRMQWRRWELRPGLFGLWWIRRRANIDYASESETDLEYRRNHGLRADLSIAARAVPALFYGGAAVTYDDWIAVLGVRLDNLTMEETLTRIDAVLDQTGPHQIRFVNADGLNRAYSDRGYRDVLNSPGLTLADGIGVKLAGRILGRPVRQNVNGTDLFPRLCERLAARHARLFLLGARPGVAELAAEWVRVHFPAVTIAGYRHGYFTPEEDEEVVTEINTARADVLLVAFGSPLQELWIHARIDRLGVRAAAGVGGLLDFYSGRIRRAPQWVRDMGLEWFYRLVQEPRRMWRRYVLGNFAFLARVAGEKLGYRPWQAAQSAEHE